MDRETVNRLMLDRALGALPADCEILLAEYLQTHPEVAADASEIEATASLARKALAEPVPTHMPAFPVGELARSQICADVALASRGSRPEADPLALRSGLANANPVASRSGLGAVGAWARWCSGIAAALLLGFGTHAFLYNAQWAKLTQVDGTTPTHAGRTTLVNAGPQPARETRPEGDNFWSARRLYEHAAQGRPGQSEHVIWDSPLKLPRLGDQT
jgi:anti-sigma factor RsiW